MLEETRDEGTGLNMTPAKDLRFDCSVLPTRDFESQDGKNASVFFRQCGSQCEGAEMLDGDFLFCQRVIPHRGLCVGDAVTDNAVHPVAQGVLNGFVQWLQPDLRKQAIGAGVQA